LGLEEEEVVGIIDDYRALMVMVPIFGSVAFET